MGVKAWFAVFFDEDPKVTLAAGPQLDRDASQALAAKLLPNAQLTEKEDRFLFLPDPRRKEILVGDCGGLKIVAHGDLGKDCLSRIAPRWRSPDLGKTVYVHATHSVVDWFAFALWQNGQLQRTLSVSTDNGIIEDIGDRLAFEAPFWSGEHGSKPEGDEEADLLPFHPLDLGEASLLENLGFQFEGRTEDWICDPMQLPIMSFGIRTTAWWKFW